MMMGKKKAKNPNSSVILQWGIPIVILLLVMCVLVSNFTSISNKSAREAINKRLTTETTGYAAEIRNSLVSVASVGEGAAAIMQSTTEFDNAKFNSYAKNLCMHVNDAYMVAVVDKDGHGVASNGEVVNLANTDYYSLSQSQQFVFTESDNFTNKDAYICSVPITTDGSKVGDVYLYVHASDMDKYLPTKDYGGSVAFAIINSEGAIVDSAGATSYFNSGDNLFTNLSTSTMSQLTLSQVKVRVEKQNKMVFSAGKGDEMRTICMSPIGVNDWQLAVMINQKYVETALNNELTNTKNLVIGLVITVCSFLVLVAVIALISKLKYGEQSKDLANKADTDLLTELNNKIATERKIQEFMNDNPDSQCLMFLFDIDNFKKINDTMGHAFGDEVLRTLGHQLRNEFRVSDIIGRLGGDEFVLFLKNIKSDEQLEREGIRITNFFHQFRAGDYVKYSATASIGGAVFPRDAKDFQSLYKVADTALYEAKRRGKNQLVFYGKDLSGVESVRVSDAVEPIGDYRKS